MNHTSPHEKHRFVRSDAVLVSVLGVLVFLLMGWATLDEMTPEWVRYQKEFRSIVDSKFGPERASSVPEGIQQVYVKELGRTDRCITCHQGVDWKGLEDAPEPFRTHPGAILGKHPVEQYGCTVCHDGQGFATNVADAHGLVEGWEHPLLGKELGEFYVVSEKSALMQINCNRCHRYEKETPGATYINRAKRIVTSKGCRACHVINGRGGSVGPDLTSEGGKSPEQFNYERIKGFHSEFSWQVAHLKNPKELVPESVMPNFNFSSQEAQSLAMLVMSWKQADVPIDYVPDHNFRDLPSPEELEREHRMMQGPGAFFVRKNCFVCHSVSTLGIEAASQIGPDLALAVSDVQARFGRTLDDFLDRPTGTMEVVLSTMITLTREEKKEAIEKLRLAYQLKQEADVAGKQRPMKPQPH